MNAEEMRKILGPLLNEFGEHQWRCGRGIPGAHEDLESSFEAVISAACAAARTEEVRVLREALTKLMRHFPTDIDMAEAGWTFAEIEQACQAHDAACAALEQTK